ncbi:MAG: Rieske 2Fe-2S domain-containing protein [Bacteroidetes bacterium]|nr:Rieske 2Fe-2S domain-containing protein [Bacteroidota bacterium]
MSNTSRSADADLSRRRFLVHGCTAAALIGLGIPLSACDSGGSDTPDGITVSGNTITIDLTKATALASEGRVQTISSAKVIAVNVGGMIYAYTNECPHEHQTVSQYTSGYLVCPTHNSVFSATTGAFVEGPSGVGPLTKYSATKSGNTVTITKA